MKIPDIMKVVGPMKWQLVIVGLLLLHTNVTNIAGYYRVDNLYSGRLYDVWSSKTGYSNSTIAQKLAVGV